MATGDRVIASAHNGLNAYLLSSNIVKYLRPLAIGGKGLLADTTAYLGDYQWGVPTASMPLKKHHNKMVCMYLYVMQCMSILIREKIILYKRVFIFSV